MGRQTVDEHQFFLIASLSTMRAHAHFGCATAAIDRAAALSRGAFYASDAAAVFPAATTLLGDSIGKAIFGNWDSLVINRQSLRPNRLSMRAAASHQARLPIP
ncbi:hypothetical protein [Paraburkholderia sp. BL25I1N1]|uniref:hypothetical protein n=1 Tax=Paraburkholderia sp. BL25I1N1 TaxID=1938804 RepID=UPI0011B1F507|nr:hypothetical protein [Paraburkholderia sp. BL25I1N1]